MDIPESEIPGVFSLGEVLGVPLDRGSREKDTQALGGEDLTGGITGKYRLRTPTNSERLNRSLIELGSAAFKVHMLLWKWRGAPARGLLPFFTFHSLSRFCNLSRPTIRKALQELIDKGWIRAKNYNVHHKNTLYELVGVRKVPAPGPGRPDRRGRSAEGAANRRG